jgi:hypothetical protein
MQHVEPGGACLGRGEVNSQSLESVADYLHRILNQLLKAEDRCAGPLQPRNDVLAPGAIPRAGMSDQSLERFFQCSGAGSVGDAGFEAPAELRIT